MGLTKKQRSDAKAQREYEWLEALRVSVAVPTPDLDFDKPSGRGWCVVGQPYGRIDVVSVKAAGDAWLDGYIQLRDPVPIYSRRVDALRYLRSRLALSFGEQLANVDLEIASAEKRMTKGSAA